MNNDEISHRRPADDDLGEAPLPLVQGAIDDSQSAPHLDDAPPSSSQGSDPQSVPVLDDEPLTLAQGAGLLAELSDALGRMQQATAEAVDLVGRVQRAGVVETIEGLPLELLLALEHRLVSSDAHMMMEAARVLQRMPVTQVLFREGKLSWGQVRGIVARLRRMKVEDLPRVDERMEASLAQIDKYSPDELMWAVEQAADEIDGARTAERREQHQVEASFLAIQPSFDGSLQLYGELDPVSGATCLNALEAASGPPDGEPGEPGEASARARQRAQALVRICGDWLGGASGRPARPLLIAHVDVASDRCGDGGAGRPRTATHPHRRHGGGHDPRRRPQGGAV